MEAWVGVTGIIVGALAGAIGTFFTTKSTMRLEFENAYDRSLRDIRLDHYQRLFHISECVPREWRAGEPTRHDLLGFREEFHSWYFGENAGGLFLTSSARDYYFQLQNELQAQASRQHGEGELDRISPEASKVLRKFASDLRHQLAADLGTAEPPRVRWTRLGPTLAPPSELSAPPHAEFE